MKETLRSYFPQLTDAQIAVFERVPALYRYWNDQINVVSRKDIDNIFEHHILHSLALAKVIRFATDTTILDVGTGGGFPGIPLAIMFPECTFHLVDSIGKKIKVVNEISRELGLKNVTTAHARAEQISGSYDFVVGRAVTALPEFFKLIEKKIHARNRNELSNGIIYLTGGEIEKELTDIKRKITVWNIQDFFSETFFETKKVIHISAV